MSTTTEDPLRRVLIHDREFQKHSVDERIYCVPVDDREEERLAAQNDILYELCGERYFLSNVGDPEKILECGFGRGDWCVQVAEQYEDCEVTGVDIYPALVSDQPDNLTLYGYNLNDRLIDPEVFERNAYDLVHSRFVAQGIKMSRWSPYIQDIKRLVRPNGFLEMTEYYLNIQSDNGQLADGSALRRWWGHYVSAMQISNRDPRIGRALQQLLVDAGFKSVGGTTLHLPIGGWHADATMVRIGQKSVAMMGELLDSASLWLFTARLGMTATEVDRLNNDAKSELQDASLRLYVPIYVAWGRRRSERRLG